MALGPIERVAFVGKWGMWSKHGAMWLTGMQNCLVVRSNLVHLLPSLMALKAAPKYY